jgi:hypothetical protein
MRAFAGVVRCNGLQLLAEAAEMLAAIDRDAETAAGDRDAILKQNAAKSFAPGVALCLPDQARECAAFVDVGLADRLDTGTARIQRSRKL